MSTERSAPRLPARPLLPHVEDLGTEVLRAHVEAERRRSPGGDEAACSRRWAPRGPRHPADAAA